MHLNFTAIVPLLLSFVAFILSMLCIFAGSAPGYLESASMLTLNSSMVGHTTLNTTKTSSSPLASAEAAIKGDVNQATAAVAKATGLHDFYSAHVLNYCEGFYTKGQDGKLTATENVTHCSNQTSMFHFDPSTILQSELPSGFNISVAWPQSIQDSMKNVAAGSKVMFVLYAMAAATTGLAFLSAVVAVFAGGNLLALANALLCLVAFMALMIASAISTAVITNVVNAVNKHGGDIGLAAARGNVFIGMTWAATVLIVVCAGAWMLEAGMRRKRAVSYVP